LKTVLKLFLSVKLSGQKVSWHHFPFGVWRTDSRM